MVKWFKLMKTFKLNPFMQWESYVFAVIFGIIGFLGTLNIFHRMIESATGQAIVAITGGLIFLVVGFFIGYGLAILSKLWKPFRYTMWVILGGIIVSFVLVGFLNTGILGIFGTVIICLTVLALLLRKEYPLSSRIVGGLSGAVIGLLSPIILLLVTCTDYDCGFAAVGMMFIGLILMIPFGIGAFFLYGIGMKKSTRKKRRKRK